jgi:hypothetical protein
MRMHSSCRLGHEKPATAIPVSLFKVCGLGLVKIWESFLQSAYC